MAPKLDGLSPRELAALIQEAQAQLSVSRSKHVAAVRAKIEALLKTEGLALADVYPRKAGHQAKRAGAGVAKYRNPNQPDQTWTGFGKKPAWFIAALKKRGVTEASLRVDVAGTHSKAAKAKRTAKTGKRAPRSR